MRKVISFVIVQCVTTIILCASPSLQQPINTIIGDVSFIQKFGYKPTDHVNEQLRIRTHLQYVEQLLRKATTQHLTETQRQKRSYLLDRLHEYWVIGRFPVNLGYPNERRPCFIDKFGRICAVGYLIEQDAGRELANIVNTQYQYEYIYNMNVPELHDWIEQSGLSLKECAMIQPGYDIEIPDNSFVINSITPATTTATKQLFNIVFDVDGIPTSATSGVILYGRLVYTLPPPIIRFPNNEQEVFLPLVHADLSTSILKPGRTRGILTFRVYGDNLWVPTYRASVYFSSNEIIGSVITYRNVYYTATPAAFNVTTTTSVQVNESMGISIFPNPTNDLVNVNLDAQSNVQIKIATIQGHILFEDIVKDSARPYAVDVSNFTQGIYFVEISSREKRIVKKLVKF